MYESDLMILKPQPHNYTSYHCSQDPFKLLFVKCSSVLHRCEAVVLSDIGQGQWVGGGWRAVYTSLQAAD